MSEEIAAAGGEGRANAVSGEAMETAQMQESTVEEVLGAVAIIVPIILFLLVVSTMSWIEPLLFIAVIGVSILINMGTNIVLGQVSFVTYSVSPILQLAVHLTTPSFFCTRSRPNESVRPMWRRPWFAPCAVRPPP